VVEREHALVLVERAHVVAALGPRPGEAVLDCCAAPGGKTFFDYRGGNFGDRGPSRSLGGLAKAEISVFTI
jgi:hypothetical protein